MNILDKILAHKKIEITRAKGRVTVEGLKQNEWFGRKTFSLAACLSDETKTGIIAEFKRRSPSRGMINDTAGVEEVTIAYSKYGASGLSVLTDEYFFGASPDDFMKARINAVPILRKDFIIDEYQVVEAKAMGADVILLIAACLTPVRTKELAFFAKELQLEVLLEIHNEEELEHICDETVLVGINNRDLKTFSVNINCSLELGKLIPKNKIKIAESGIDSMATIDTFKAAGFKGFLMGEKFMKEERPGEAFKEFVQQLKQP